MKIFLILDNLFLEKIVLWSFLMNGKIRQIKFFPSQNLTIEHIFCTNEGEIIKAF